MPTFRAPAILFLKATTTTTITVPGYYRKDGTFVPPHQKLVHINPDKSKADVLSGKGSHSQKVAHSKLSKLPGWASMTEDEQHAHILSWATNYQQKQSAAAAVSGWKASMLEGKKPTASQQAAFVALPKDKQLALGAEVGLPASMVEVMGAKPAEQQPKDAPLHVFTNPGAGLESKVILGSSGKYHVVLKDTDSGEHVPTVNIHDTEAAAVADAKKAAGVKTDAEPSAAAPETVTVEPQSGKTGPTTFPLPPAEFESYAAAQAWAASRAKAAGMQKKQFEASHEYAHAFPAIMAAYEHDMMGWAKEKAAHAAAMQQGMADAGVKAGDTVAWTHVGSFLNATQHSGVVKLSSDGVPYVHLGYEVPVAKKGGKIGYVKKLAWQPYMLPAGAAASGPKDGDTKAGANGQQLVFKNGRWHKVVAADEHGEVPPALVPVEDEAAGPDLSTASSWSVLKKQKEDDPTKVFQMAEAWLAANPTKGDDLSSTLVDLGFLGVAKVMGIYKPPSAGLKSPSLADHAKADAENEAAAAKIDELVAGTGGHYPVKAAKAITAKLKDDPEFLASWSAITHVQRLQIIVDLAKEYQAAASASAAVSGWKKAAHAGKNPTQAQWKAFYALPAGKKAEMLSAVHAAAGGTDHLKAPAATVLLNAIKENDEAEAAQQAAVPAQGAPAAPAKAAANVPAAVKKLQAIDPTAVSEWLNSEPGKMSEHAMSFFGHITKPAHTKFIKWVQSANKSGYSAHWKQTFLSAAISSLYGKYDMAMLADGTFKPTKSITAADVEVGIVTDPAKIQAAVIAEKMPGASGQATATPVTPSPALSFGEKNPGKVFAAGAYSVKYDEQAGEWQWKTPSGEWDVVQNESLISFLNDGKDIEGEPLKEAGAPAKSAFDAEMDDPSVPLPEDVTSKIDAMDVATLQQLVENHSGPKGYKKVLDYASAKLKENAAVTLSPSQEAAIVDALKLNGGEMPGAGTGVGYYASIWDSLSPEKQADLKAKAKGGAPANTAGSGKVVVGGKMYVKDGDVWSSVATGAAFHPGSFRHAALSVINGDPVSPAMTGGAKAMALAWMFDQSNNEHGVSPQKALNALFPPAGGGPEEGDTEEVNGTTYVLKNGRWHKLGEELDGGAAPDSAIEKNAASLQGTQYELKDGAWIDANGSAAPPMYALALNLIAGKEIDPEVAAKNSGMMSNGKLFAAKMAVAEGVSPVVALNALFPRSGENAPKDGNKKTIGDVDYVMKDGVWHDPKDIDENWLPPDLKSALDYFFDEKDEYNLQWAVDNGTPAQASYAKQKLAELHGAKLDTLHGTENNFGDIPESGAGGDVEWDVFSNTEPGHNKFWAVSVNGDQMITHYGKIGSTGTTTVKKFASNGEALAAASKLQKQKQAKGYTFTGTDFYPVPDGAKAAPKPAAEVIKPKPALESADGWPQTGPQGGSNPGGRFKDPSGQEWYIKLPASEAHAKNELLAAKLYEAAGIKVPELKLVTMNGKVGIASKWVGGMSKTKHPDELAMADGALSGFAVDAWLANWDVTGLGLDNLLVGPDGKAVRIDVGGSLLFRAQGSPKGGAFGNEVTELQSLVDPKMNPLSAALFDGMSKAAQEKSAERVLKVSDEQIAALVDQFGPGSAAERAALAQKLIARKAAIAAAFPSAKGAEKPKAAEPAKPKLDPTALQVNPNDLPPYHDFHNWNGPGKGLSSKAHINDANLKAEKDLHDFALKGNLVALKDYHFEAIDKETGASLGMKPISEHPSQHVKLYHSDLVQYLDAIANPPEPLRVSEGNDPAQFKPEKLGKTISTVQANKKLGFWVALGKLSKAEPFVKYFVGKEKPVSSAYKTQAKAKGIDHLPKLARRFINRVQSSGSYNDYFRDGHDSDHDGYSTAAIASAVYSAASPKPAGTTIYRWQNMPESMVKQLLAAEPGLVFQNPGSMCCSMSPTGTSGFGQHRMVIHYAEGAMAVDSFASGSFAGEQEITTLMGQRFMLLRSEMSNNLGGIGKNGLEIHVLMLPPDPDYVADLQQRAATTTLKKSHRVFNELMGIEA